MENTPKKSRVKVLKSPYNPRPIQLKLHNELTQFSVIVAHRRFGKTVFCINHLIQTALSNKLKNPQYAYIAPEKTQCKRIAWKYFKEYTEFLPEVKFYESELRIEFKVANGSSATIYLEGAEEPDRLRGLYLDGVVMDEVAQMPSSMWKEIILPALSDRNGYAIFIGTPKGKNSFYDLFQLGLEKQAPWSSFLFKASETKIFTEDQLYQLRKFQGDELYEQEYECSFNSVIKGTFYGKYLAELRDNGYVGTYDWDPKYPVITAWDLGINDKTTIWFAQQISDIVYVIDYYENSDEAIPFYIKVVKSKPYTYAYHILPHDVKQRNSSTGFTRLSEFISNGFKCRVAPKLPIADGINAVRSLLPICRFKESSCQKGLDALFHYRSDPNEKLGVMNQQPVHDWSSHASDAFRYLAVGLNSFMMNPVHLMTPEERNKKFKGYDDFNPLHDLEDTDSDF